MRLFEVDLPFLRIVDDAGGADFPEWRRTSCADAAARGDDLGQGRVALSGASDLDGRKLELSVQDKAGAAQDSGAHVAVERRFVGEQDRAAIGFGQADRPLHRELTRPAVEDDTAGSETAAFVEYLDRALGDERPVAFDLNPVRHQAGHLRRRGDGPEQQHQKDETQQAHPSSRCSSRPSGSRIAATGGPHAASRTGICPFSPRIWAKFRMK